MTPELYLERIGINRSYLPVTIDTLCLLQMQHSLHVPFENIDIQNRTPVILDTDLFYQKIVFRKRGGYCYECNGLFAELLTALGFDARLISCRVAQRKGNVGQEFDHLAIIVTLDHQEWLVDAGFGDFSMKPLLLHQEANKAQSDGRNDYLIAPFNNLTDKIYFSVSRWEKAKQRFAPVYIFHTEGYPLSAFEEMNHYQQTNPKSHFLKSLICTLPTHNGRISLIANRLVLTSLTGDREEKLLYGTDAIARAFQEYFGMGNTSLVTAL